MPTSLLDSLHPNFRRQAVEVLAQLLEAGVAVQLVRAGLTPAEQSRLVIRTGLAHREHVDGLALDVCPLDVDPDPATWDAADPRWTTIGVVAHRLGLAWGGQRRPDDPRRAEPCALGHIELPRMHFA